MSCSILNLFQQSQHVSYKRNKTTAIARGNKESAYYHEQKNMHLMIELCKKPSFPSNVYDSDKRCILTKQMPMQMLISANNSQLKDNTKTRKHLPKKFTIFLIWIHMILNA